MLAENDNDVHHFVIAPDRYTRRLGAQDARPVTPRLPRNKPRARARRHAEAGSDCADRVPSELRRWADGIQADADEFDAAALRRPTDLLSSFRWARPNPDPTPEVEPGPGPSRDNQPQQPGVGTSRF
jgi:hypothetical protein